MCHYWKLTAIKKKMGEEGGKYAPQTLIPLEQNVGLTSNQAVNSSFAVNLWSIKKN